MSALFDLRDIPASPAPHACSGVDVCQVCQLTRTSAEAKNLGTSRVSRDPAWWNQANEYLQQLHRGDTFTADDLTHHIGLPDGSPNQVGACIKSWVAQKRINHSGYKAARRKSSHGRVLSVWMVK